ncbi:MAG: hypothetical protein WBJ87_08285 [Candidatus Hydrothermia bacterium]
MSKLVEYIGNGVIRILRVANKETRQIEKLKFVCENDYEKSVILAKKFCKQNDYTFISLNKKIYRASVAVDNIGLPLRINLK